MILFHTNASCIVIILMDHKTTEGVLDTFEITENDYELHLSVGILMAWICLLRVPVLNILKPRMVRTNIYILARTISFQLYLPKHISSISGECLPIPRLNELGKAMKWIGHLLIASGLLAAAVLLHLYSNPRLFTWKQLMFPFGSSL